MKFFEAFPNLKVKKELSLLFEEVEVIKVVSNKERSLIRVYIESDHLILKDDIFSMEDAIKKQVFRSEYIKEQHIMIAEHFTLSSQYNLANIYEKYRNGLYLEIKRHRNVLYSLIKDAPYEVDGDTLKIDLPDSFIARQSKAELEDIFYKVFKSRFDISINTEFNFCLEKTERAKKAQKASDEEYDNYVARKLSQVSGSENGEEHSKAEKSAAKNEKPATKAKEKEEKPAFTPKTASRPKTEKSSDVIYGRDFDGDVIALSDVVTENQDIIANVKIMSTDVTETRKKIWIFRMNITDFTDSIAVKLFLREDNKDEVIGALTKGAFIKIKGTVSFDNFDNELTLSHVYGIKPSSDFTSSRFDDASEKRVELHLHTKMSDMDGIINTKEIVKRAYKWGHRAVAITDHGVVQSFPEAFHVYQDLKGDYKKAHDGDMSGFDFKIIYGMEGYMVDDLVELVKNSKGQSLMDSYVVFDLETTGLSKYRETIIEIGAVKVEGGKVTDRFSTFVNPEKPIPYEIEKLTGISDSMVEDAKTIKEILPEFLEFCRGCSLVAHNAEFDYGFICQEYLKLRRNGLIGAFDGSSRNDAELTFNQELADKELDFTVVDTLTLSRTFISGMKKYTLDHVAKELKVVLGSHHRAVDDAECTAGIFIKLCERIIDKGIENLDQLNEFGAGDDEANTEAIRKLKYYHIIFLCQNETGRVNLYRMVSMSHLKYFNRRPLIPKSEIIKHREGILIGSACEAGELYRALLDEKSDEDVAKIAQFYDYLELQPLGNNGFMVRQGYNDESKNARFDSFDQVIDINKKIISLGDQFNKLVVATCDAHFLNPEDEVYRRLIMASKGFDDADHQAPLFFRTTKEMLEEFNYLGEDKAYELVVTNTNKISDMIEIIEPVRPDKCPPVIENSDEDLRRICYETAHNMYGENLPPQVTERLEKELNSIISNGYAVMYIIAQKLVWKSNEDGYLVGSRGSVGSSFVATMAGITEVNPLKPHYRCLECKYYDFDSVEVVEFAKTGASGCDMPDKICPVCGKPLYKDGFDIPFETFLGFKGDKEPDIDLNFSNEYQSKAHAYTEVIFGKGQTFKAGTVGTLQDKKCYGIAKKYFEERGIEKRRPEIERLMSECIGVRTTTGQHPGGIVVLPHGEEINTFTPIQHPANDMNSTIVTTHFEYHSIDHNLLKLDILGHLDPTMIKMLESLTGLDAKTIKFDDEKVLSLFTGTSALGVTPDDIDCPLGCLGVPEFGTDFVIQMLLETKPQHFSDLIRISGLSHGTDVWTNNAQVLVKEGKATISTAICTRDDIMIFLINQGVEPELSFKIMESVRKGKGLKPEMEEAMVEKGVPDWYIWSCKTIKYMFPKAHAAAYVMMAFRVAYFKINYPLAYYASFFSIRASDFNYEIMCQGQEKLDYYIKDYKKRKETGSLSAKEEGTLKDMKIVKEMYARGFDFTPIDVYKAKAKHFQIIDGKLMPSFMSIDGMGEAAAIGIEEGAKLGKFLSLDDFKNKTKVSSTVVEFMADMGILSGLPKSNQMSIADFF